MNVRVPLEVIEEGLTDEYVRVETASQKTYSDKYEVESRYNQLIGDLHIALTTRDNRRREYVDSFYLGERVWSHALVVEELSKQLVEAAGQLVEARKAHEQASAERDKFSIRMGWK
ncbi:hypothetical protein [Cytobacillus massiliigabonensis]|uniref:hypothetical protein n=1 Tax=Cytobacillus massiliigabonensis TaxID=1871011 RepID=UPI000C83B330|nr:hypothetical protein [Cytobacillus massiliigabonensis]